MVVITMVTRPKVDIKEHYEKTRDKIKKLMDENASENISKKRKTLREITEIQSCFNIKFIGYPEQDKYNDKLSGQIIKYIKANFPD